MEPEENVVTDTETVVENGEDGVEEKEDVVNTETSTENGRNRVEPDEGVVNTETSTENGRNRVELDEGVVNTETSTENGRKKVNFDLKNINEDKINNAFKSKDDIKGRIGRMTSNPDKMGDIINGIQHNQAAKRYATIMSQDPEKQKTVKSAASTKGAKKIRKQMYQQQIHRGGGTNGMDKGLKQLNGIKVVMICRNRVAKSTIMPEGKFLDKYRRINLSDTLGCLVNPEEDGAKNPKASKIACVDVSGDVIFFFIDEMKRTVPTSIEAFKQLYPFI